MTTADSRQTTDKQTNRHKDNRQQTQGQQTARQPDSQTARQPDSQTARQPDSQTATGRQPDSRHTDSTCRQHNNSSGKSYRFDTSLGMSAAGVTVRLEPRARHTSARPAASKPPVMAASGKFSPKFTMVSTLQTRDSRGRACYQRIVTSYECAAS